MCDMTLPLDEEEMKVDSSSEPLPEPLLLILSPPPPFLPAPGEPTMLWPKWLRAFEQYIQALGEKELADSSKLVLLQNCLGPEGERIFTTLIQNKTTYAAAVSTLAFHFSSDHASQVHRLKFHQRAQIPGETLDQFVLALENLLRPCNCESLKDALILNQLIQKTNYPQLRERLLLKRDTLSLATALAVGKEIESALNETPQFDFHEVSVDIGDDLDAPVQKKAKRGRPRKGEQRPKSKPKATITQTKSSRHKGEYSNFNNRLRCCDDDNDEAKFQSADETNLGCDKVDDDYEASFQSSRMEEEVGNKTSDDAEDYNEDDEDFVLSSAKRKSATCSICVNRHFRDAHKLARHMRTHTKEKPFTCPVCFMTFSQSYHMTRHMRNQHGASQHICPTCGESLGSFAELKRHKKTHRSQVLSCPDCNEKFTSNNEFSHHVKSHRKDQSCQKDGHSSEHESWVEVKTEEIADAQPDSYTGTDSNNKASETHVLTEDNSEVASQKDGCKRKEKETSGDKTKGHFCPICVDRRFRGPNKLARHMRTHTKERPFSCPVCDLTFSQSYHMTRHVRNQHSHGQYICSKCGTSFSTWLEMKAHKRIHAVEGLTCLACDKQFKEKAALARHLKLHRKVEASPRSLICSDCGKVFGRMYHLKRHIMTHRKGEKAECYTCPDCQKNFPFPEDLNKHLEIHVKENSGTCPKCNESFSTAEELETHMVVHQKSYSCSTCGKKFKVEYALKKHALIHQNDEYYCSMCCKHFFKLSHYKRHIMVHDRRESRCPHCDSVFLKLTALKYHLRTHTEERPHQCSCCIETFEEKEDLEQHCLKHRKFKKERPYSCTRCDYAFSTLVELTKHMTSHEGEQPQTCPVCGKTFLNKNKLERHLTIHTGERPHLCSICGNGFPSAASLKLHVHIHTGEKPYQCSQCSKSFSSSSGLRLHSRQHMDERPSFECPECGRKYGRRTELKMHQRYHTGDKPYACTCCNKRFISKDKLNVHMRTHTGERPYSCPHCGQTFTQTGDRNRHMSKYHPLLK